MRLAVQLYTLRDSLEADIRATLASVRSCGLEFVELAGQYGCSASDWRALLAESGLRAESAHIGLSDLESHFDATVSDAHTLGLRYVVVPWIGRDRYQDGWDKFGQELDSLGRKLREVGLQLAYHNHDFEFEGDGGGLDEVYASASSDSLKAELDLAWIKIGGADPGEWVRKMGTRAPLVHLKDYDLEKQPQWVAGGQGVMDWDAIIAACASAGTEFGIIELDAYAGDPIDAVRESVEFFKSKGLG